VYSVAIILFDGVCNLCNGFVQFIIARDPAAHFRFAALSSDTARALLKESGVSEPIPDTVVLVEDGRVYFRSDAPLRVARRLTFPWPLAAVFLVVPRFLRDRIYDFVASHRYRWFGKQDTCLLPTPELQNRFLR
jgi:predicted DCC family thiol-disulfide oxidoreductase YuxK